MKAIVYERHGGPDVLSRVDLPEPQPAAGEALIEVRATALNYVDLWAREGLPGMRFALPHLPGSDAAGIVRAVGPGVTSVHPGDEVVVHPGLSCRECEACTSGQEMLCRHFAIWGFQTGPLRGGYAEYAVLPAVNLVPKPANLDWPEAASVPLCLMTAWHMLAGRARVQPGDTVLVWGATSGVGVMAVQIAKLHGARVLAVAGSQAKLEAALALGADAGIDHRTQDVVAEVRRLTAKRGVDVVVEHTGQLTWERSIASMAPGARLVTCGNTTGFDARTDLRFVFNKQLSLLGSHEGTKAELLQALRFVADGRIRPVVGATFPLSEAAQAQRLVAAGDKIGKLVLLP